MQQGGAGETSLVEDPERFKVGTLTYTKAGLVTLFAWLLWGEFCFILHASVIANVLPLTLKRHGASNFLMGLLLTTMPSFLIFTLNPVVSTVSDRTRTRWGRRIPYIALAAPVTSLFLILLAFSEGLGRSLAQVAGWAPSATIVAAVAVCFAMSRVADMFIGPIYYYLFNDVVPKAFISRFITLFRMIAILGSALFQWFLYQYSETNMREIFLGAGILYMAGFTLVCLKVKEGQYPPPPEGMDRRKGLINLAGTYLKECFVHRFYWLFFLYSATWSAVSCVTLFGVFLYRDNLGLTLNQLGKISAVMSVVSALLLYPAGILSDRAHPLRFMWKLAILQCLWGITGLNWLFWNPSPHRALVIYICISAVSVPLGAVSGTITYPLLTQLLPKDRFGQFCAANSMVVCVAMMTGGVVAGGFIDLMKRLYHGSDFAYRYLPVWQLAFMLIGVAFLFLLQREWVKLGGQRGFVPPKVSSAAPSVKPA